MQPLKSPPMCSSTTKVYCGSQTVLKGVGILFAESRGGNEGKGEMVKREEQKGEDRTGRKRDK